MLELRGMAIRLKACVLVNGGYFEHRSDANCDIKSINWLDCFKVFLMSKFRFCAIIANFQQIVIVKEFRKSAMIWWSYAWNTLDSFFRTRYIYKLAIRHWSLKPAYTGTWDVNFFPDNYLGPLLWGRTASRLARGEGIETGHELFDRCHTWRRVSVAKLSEAIKILAIGCYLSIYLFIYQNCQD